MASEEKPGLRAVAAACVVGAALGPATACGTEDPSEPPERPPAAERHDDAGEPAPTRPARRGRRLFVENCGSCHALAKAGTTGTVGPDLDEHFGSHHPAHVAEIVRTIREGPGRMPANRVRGRDARAVAGHVARATRE